MSDNTQMIAFVCQWCHVSFQARSDDPGGLGEAINKIREHGDKCAHNPYKEKLEAAAAALLENARLQQCTVQMAYDLGQRPRNHLITYSCPWCGEGVTTPGGSVQELVEATTRIREHSRDCKHNPDRARCLNAEAAEAKLRRENNHLQSQLAGARSSLQRWITRFNARRDEIMKLRSALAGIRRAAMDNGTEMIDYLAEAARTIPVLAGHDPATAPVIGKTVKLVGVDFAPEHHEGLHALLVEPIPGWAYGACTFVVVMGRAESREA